MNLMYNPDAPKKPTNLSLNSDLVKKAKEVNINLSLVVESALAEELKQKMEAEWKNENAINVDKYNSFIEENGLFSDGLRGV